METELQQKHEPQKVRFDNLGLSQTTLQTLERIGYDQPSPIQAALIPVALSGRDCTGQAHTGTGKTAAFALPILERLDRNGDVPQALVLAPTRELSEQVAAETRRLASNQACRIALLVGGRPIGQQISELKRGADIVVGTPGRIIDLLRRRALDLRSLRFVVLDEADRMLDIGFRPDIEKILRQCPDERQTMLLTATLPEPVEKLARRYMRNPQRIDLSQDSVAVDTIDQYYATVDEDRKFGLLVRLLKKERPQQALVFVRTKRRTERLYRRFAGKLPHVAMMSGDLPQPKRDSVIRKFREGKIRLLIATDVCGRGLDVSGISHIINYDIPEYHDDYVHRVGRTGRISSEERGCAITFVTREQGDHLTKIEQRIDRILREYQIDGYEAYRPRKPRPILHKEEAERTNGHDLSAFEEQTAALIDG